MSRPDRIKLANDNTPQPILPKLAGHGEGYSGSASQHTGLRRHIRIESQNLRRSPIHYNAAKIPEAAPSTMDSGYGMARLKAYQNSAEKTRSWGLFFSLLATIICLSLAAACIYTGQSERLSVIALFASVWASLWTAFLTVQDDQPPRAKRVGDWCMIAATFAGLGIWNYATREWGLPISSADGAALFAGLALITALLLRSKLTLLTSASAALIGAALHIFAPSINIINPWVYPVLAAVQIVAAGRMGSKAAGFMTLTGLHMWLGWMLLSFIQSGDISVLHAAAIITMIGMAHYRLGKAIGDEGWATSDLHVVTGWGVAMIGLLALQNYWLGMDSQLWDNVSASAAGHLSWQIIGITSIGVVGFAGMIRLYHRRLSALGTFLTLLIALGAALIFDQRENIVSAAENGLYTTAQPLLGVVIGAAILASAFAMAINGARRKNSVMLIAGVIAIGAQLFMMLSPQIWSTETAVIFTLSLTISLLLASLLANDSSGGEAGRRKSKISRHNTTAAA